MTPRADWQFRADYFEDQAKRLDEEATRCRQEARAMRIAAKDAREQARATPGSDAA